MKKKNPWNPLKMTNRYWNAVEASLTVRAPKSHVKPNITIIPTMLIIVLIVALADFFFFIVWVTSTRTERMKITMLNKISANMGARKVTKNTIVSLMKQLWRKIFPSFSHQIWHLCHTIMIFIVISLALNGPMPDKYVESSDELNIVYCYRSALGKAMHFI